MASPPNAAPQCPPNAEEWVSVGAAARRLELSERTIQRKAARGELEARTVSDNQGKRLLIRFDVPTPADSLTAPSHAQNGEGADNSPRGADTSFAAHLLEENRFLRGLIEQRDRDAAELRASLREALKLGPKQLAAPSPVPQPATVAGSPIQPDAEESARNAPERAQNGEGGSYGPNVSESARIEDEGAKTPVSYASIADELERMLNQ